MAGISPNTLNLNEGTSSVSSEGTSSVTTGPMGSKSNPFTSAFGGNYSPVGVTTGNVYQLDNAGDAYTSIGVPVSNEGRSSPNAQRREEVLANAYDYDTRNNYPNVTLHNYRNPDNLIKRDEAGNFYQDVPSVNGSIGGRNYNFDYLGNDRSAPGYDASALPGFGERFSEFYNGLNTAIKTMPGAILSMDINPPLGPNSKTAAELREEANAKILADALAQEYAASIAAVSAQDNRDRESSGSASIAAATRDQLGKTQAGSKKSTTNSNVGSSDDNSGYY
jgi:hypothetical protein